MTEEEKRRLRQSVLSSRATESTTPISRSGGALNLLPAGVATAASFIPGIGSLVAAPLGGIAEILRQKAAGEDFDLKKVGKEVALSAIPFGAGKIIKGVKAARAAKAGIDVGKAAATAGRVEKAGTALRKAVIKPQVAPSPTSLLKEDELVEFAGREGLKGPAASMREQIATNFKKIGDEIKGILSQDKRTLASRTIKNRLKTASDSSIHFSPGDVAYERARERALGKLDTLAKNGQLTTQKLFEYKSELGGRLGNAFRKVRGELSTPLTINEAAEMSLWDSIDDIVTKLNPAVKDLTLRQSMYHQLTPGVIKSAESALKIAGIPIPGAARTGQAVADITGRGLKSVSSIGAVPGMETLKRGAGQIASRSLLGGTADAVFGIEQPKTGMDIDTAIPEYTGGSYSGGITATGIRNAIEEDLRATGGQNVEFYQNIAKMSGIDLEGGGDLTADQQKRLTNLGNVQSQLDQLEQSVRSSGIFPDTNQLVSSLGGWGKKLIGKQTDPETRTYIDQLRGRGIMVIRAMGEVGNLSEAEQEAAVRQLPAPGDNLETAESKLKSLRDIFQQARENALTFGGYE